MIRVINIVVALIFSAIGIAGISLGLWRVVVDGELLHGLANIIVGGLVAIQGAVYRRECL